VNAIVPARAIDPPAASAWTVTRRSGGSTASPRPDLAMERLAALLDRGIRGRTFIDRAAKARASG
jgi:hypothetical protein